MYETLPKTHSWPPQTGVLEAQVRGMEELLRLALAPVATMLLTPCCPYLTWETIEYSLSTGTFYSPYSSHNALLNLLGLPQKWVKFYFCTW